MNKDFNEIGRALDTIHKYHKNHEGPLWMCTPCLVYWIRLVWPQQPRRETGTYTLGHLGKYRGGDPDDVRESRLEIMRDRKNEL